MSIDIVPAHLAVQAMRDNGYKNAAYAIAELMDNSIQAGATIVELLCSEQIDLVAQRRRSRIHQIAVLDNGSGMDAEVLKLALQFGNGTHLTPDTQDGMGRFGMGLPSASISQCTKVEVWSWQDGVESALYTYIDLDKIRSQEQRAIPEPTHVRVPKVWEDASGGLGHTGTLVVWSNLDRIMWRTAQTIIENSEFLIGRMYRRFLNDGTVTIRMVAFNGEQPRLPTMKQTALPNDPGYLIERTSCPEPYSKTPMFQPWGNVHEVNHVIKFDGQDHNVTVRFSYAKEEARQLGPKGQQAGSMPHGQHAAKNVGISIVRAGRELDLDQTWVIRYNPVERWWGIEIEFPPSLDELFGVTNNKQAARNFAELQKLDLDALLKDGSITRAMEQLEHDEDPRAPLLEIANKIQRSLSNLRQLLDAQTKGMRTKPQTRHQMQSPEAVATAATRERQEEGQRGASDHDEQLPAEQRQAQIEQSLIAEGVSATAAKQMAATTVSDGYKYVFAEAPIDSAAFFNVKMQGGAIEIILNTKHPAYKHLVEVLDADDGVSTVEELQERLATASSGLKLLLSAWARYEDEQQDGRPRERAQDARHDWGRMARRFLERED